MKRYSRKLIRNIINCVAVISFLSLIGITIAFVGCEDIDYGFVSETYISPSLQYPWPQQLRGLQLIIKN